jgi:flagellar capping protein FliD
MESNSTDNRIDDVSARTGRFEENVKERFDKVDCEFDKVDRRFERTEDKIDTRFDKVDAQFEKVDARQDKQDGKLDAINRTVWFGIALAVVVKFLFG